MSGSAGRRHSPRWGLAALALVLATLACRGGGSSTLAFSPDQLPDATAGHIFSATITITQNATPVGQMTVAPGDLPPGLSFTFLKGQDSALLSGTPLHAGTYKFTVSAWCFGTNTAGQTGHHDYQLVVHAATSQ